MKNQVKSYHFRNNDAIANLEEAIVIATDNYRNNNECIVEVGFTDNINVSLYVNVILVEKGKVTEEPGVYVALNEELYELNVNDDIYKYILTLLFKQSLKT